jgi:DNA replication initiation complex subunit (GINS family)
MEKEKINYKTLRRIQQAEQTTAGLTKIDVLFYQDLSKYLKDLENSVQDEKNPQKLKLFSDEIVNTQKIANSIYELREKKIVQSALSTVRGGTPELRNLLDSEKKLYDTLVEQITSSRREILEEPLPHTVTKQHESPSDITQQKNEPNTNPIVRVLEDTPEFVGTDEKTYSLRKEDVLTLPKETGTPLLKKGIVKQIK